MSRDRGRLATHAAGEPHPLFPPFGGTHGWMIRVPLPLCNGAALTRTLYASTPVVANLQFEVEGLMLRNARHSPPACLSSSPLRGAC